jgi:hypothetical protein
MPFASHERKLDYDNKVAAESSRGGRDITAGYSQPGDLDARNACERDFRLFCEWYFPSAFSLAWSRDHLLAIQRMQEVVLGGGLFALAMPRGSGKTTLSVRAAIWALLYGHRRFVCLVAATEGLACKLLDHFKTELTFNERLVVDFRQVCYPLVRLENNGRKAIGQLFDGQQTRIGWGDSRLTFPTMPDWACDGKNVSGSTVTVAGLTGALRGQSTTLPTGEVIRPELVLMDDPQTRESALSALQSNARESIIKADVLGMAGPGKRIAAIMPCTVIRKGDMADLMLDRDRNPAWSGQKTKMIYSFPADQKAWEEYGRLWSEGLRSGRGTGEATEYYRGRRAQMDEGADVAWPERHYEDELSAVQHAMNLRLLDEPAFFAEYQNDPQGGDASDVDDLTADRIAEKINRMPRCAVPIGCSRVTAFIDVQKELLYWLVCAWEDDFTGSVIDYGAWPGQSRSYFSLRDAGPTLSDEFPSAGVEGRIYSGLKALTGDICQRVWSRDDGAEMRIERCLIDANWGQSTDTVYEFCRKCAFPSIVMPSHGRGIGASGMPLAALPKKPGDRAGLNWKLPNVAGRRAVRYAIYDTNYWKSFVHSRLSQAMGDRGSLDLFGDKPHEHRLLSDHLTAEYRIRTSGRGREVDEWKPRPEGRDNHWWDCLVGAAVAASIQGAAIAEAGDAARVPRERKRVSLDELRRRAKGA